MKKKGDRRSTLLEYISRKIEKEVAAMSKFCKGLETPGELIIQYLVEGFKL